MSPRTRKTAMASSSKSAVPADEIPVIEMKPAEAANSSDPDAKIVVDEGEEDMEVFEMANEDDESSTKEAKVLPNKEDKQRLYATGAGGYNALKTFQGQVYSGMAVGGSHTWNYDQGVWKETKVEPDRWEIDYTSTKRRARTAPKGSGVPVGAQYHWFIVGHQVRSLSTVVIIVRCFVWQ